jgi:hypothetical protein
MEVSDRSSEPNGQELVDAVVALTGLPAQWIGPELAEILDQNDQSETELTLDQLRSAMLNYLEKMNEGVAEQSALE